MIKEIQLRTNLIEEKKEGALLHKAAKKLGVDSKEISGIKLLRKSIDARKKKFSLITKLQYILMKTFLKNQHTLLSIKMFLKLKKFILLVLVLPGCMQHYDVLS